MPCTFTVSYIRCEIHPRKTAVAVGIIRFESKVNHDVFIKSGIRKNKTIPIGIPIFIPEKSINKATMRPIKNENPVTEADEANIKNNPAITPNKKEAQTEWTPLLCFVTFES